MSQPNTLSTLYIDFVGKSEAPTILHRWSFISMLGAVIGRRFIFKHGHSIIRPNLYTVLIAEPATRKSTAIKIAKRLAVDAGYKRCTADRTTKEGFLTWMDGTHTDKEKTKKGENQTTQEFGLDLLDNLDLDAPREAWAAADELFNFLGQRNIDFITMLGEFWDYEGVYEYKIRNAKDVRVPFPTVALLGGCTYETFSLTFPPESIGTGFMSRAILVHCDPLDSSSRITWPVVPDETKREVILLALNMILSLDATDSIELEPDEEAMHLLDSIYITWKGVPDQRFAHYNSRRFAHLLKLLIICTIDRLLVESPESLFNPASKIKSSRGDVIFANTILAMTELSMPRALGEFGSSKYAKVQNKIVELLRTHKVPVQFNEIWKAVMKDMDKISDLVVQMQALVAGGMVVSIEGKGYTFIEQQHDPMIYTDWSLLHPQEIELYKP